MNRVRLARNFLEDSNKFCNESDIGSGMNGAHVNGYLWKFCPNKNWKNLKKEFLFDLDI